MIKLILLLIQYLPLIIKLFKLVFDGNDGNKLAVRQCLEGMCVAAKERKFPLPGNNPGIGFR